jgi:endonuclease-3
MSVPAVNSAAAGKNKKTKRSGPTPARVARILELLDRHYPDARCSLDFSTPLELLVATILSAQCTDERVNKVTPALFAKYRTAGDYAAADPAVFQQEIR